VAPHDDLTHRVGRIVCAERERLARRRPDLDAEDLAEVEEMLWRIADYFVLRHLLTADPAAVARLWD
jgi:hypothetical protein